MVRTLLPVSVQRTRRTGAYKVERPEVRAMRKIERDPFWLFIAGLGTGLLIVLVMVAVMRAMGY
jgi:bacteriorhodopsin